MWSEGESSMKLSQRESEVLELLLKGKTSNEIGKELFISPYTVKNHRAKILKKLGARNTTELIIKTMKEGC